ncbi:hypothetical protein DMB68_10055 [Flavobacterium hydrophilum]|uniref:Uncharacterized protein n=2 Tax=Flavobacterium TaxID=237 RepID=A0A2V4C168_9FLAO|nr:hypothetical protein DMB68_10055 [Flavobacterium hydrophilum]
MEISIQNFKNNIIVDDCDITCTEKKGNSENIIACSIVYFKTFKSQLKVKFEWKEKAENLNEINFVFIPETKMIFFRSVHQWGAIEIETKTLKRHEDAFNFPFIEHKQNFILVEDELYAESCKLNGDKIDNIPIDPPWEVQEFQDRIEYDSPVFGHQILKTNYHKF